VLSRGDLDLAEEAPGRWRRPTPVGDLYGDGDDALGRGEVTVAITAATGSRSIAYGRRADRQ